MAKLYGTADAVLVSAAFKHGQSTVGFDMKDIYKQRMESVKTFTTAISDMFNSIYADNKNTMDLLTDNAQKALEIMETGDFINEGGIEFHNGIVNDYKAKLKEINAKHGVGKGGDLERSKLRAEMNRYLSVLESSDQMFQNMTKNAANSRLLNDLGDDKVNLYNMILEDHNNGTSIVEKEYKNGDILYGIPGSDVKISMSEINKGMSTYDPEYLTNVNSLLTKFKAKGKAMGGNMSEDDALRFKNEIQSSITSWDEIRNVSQAKLGNMKFSFEEVLTGQAVDGEGNINTDLISLVYDELEALGGIDITGPDGNPDGVIDDADKSLLAKAKENGEVYVSPENGFTLIDALKKDKQKYRNVMANYLTETAVKDFYSQGAAQSKTKVIKNGKDKNSGLSLLKSNKSTELFGTNNGWTNNSILNSLGTAINNRENIPLAEGEGEMIWDDKAGYIYKDVQGNTTIIDDKASLFQTFFQSESPISSPTLQTEWWKSVKGWQVDQRIEGTFDETSGLNVGDLEQDDNLVVTKLNESIPAKRTKQNKEGYYFDLTRDAVFGVGDFTQDAVVLRDKNNNPVKFPEGHKYAGKEAAFKVDQSSEAELQSSFDYLMEILEHFNLKKRGSQMTAEDYVNERQ